MTPDSGTVHSIFPLSAELLPWALELTNSEGWDYRLGDLEMLCELEPAGNLVACDEQDHPVGYLTALAFPPLGLIGNVATVPEVRKRGVATALMEAALTYLEGLGCTTQRLFSYTHTMGVYHRLGFEATGVTTTLQGLVPKLGTETGPVPYDDGMLAELQEFDLNTVKYDRGRLLERLLDACGPMTLVSLDGRGALDGYLIAGGSPGPGVQVAYEVGPWVVASGCGNWRALLENTLAGLEPKAKVELSTVADNQRVMDLCAGLGIGPCYSTIDMVRGQSRELPEQNVLARAGLVKG